MGGNTHRTTIQLAYQRIGYKVGELLLGFEQSFVEAAGKSLEHIHISDSGELGDCLPVGKGNFRFRQFFDKVNSVNPDASVILELYRNSFRGISDLVSGYNILANMTAQYKNRGD